MEKRYLNVKEAGDFIAVSRWTIYRMVKDQQIPFIPVRGNVRFDVNDLVSYMEKHKIHAIGEKK